jgi:glutamyl/glutaminyl-tRNA synthetase
MEDLKKKTKVKGKKLFMPIRIALTGSHEGPELAALLPSLGKEKVLGRIHRALEGL